MNRVEIEVRSSNGAHAVRLRRSPLRDLNDDELVATIYLQPNQRPYTLLQHAPPGIVRKCGVHLAHRISLNKSVERALRHLEDSGASNTAIPIFFEVSRELDALPWEALWRKQMKFLSLNPRASIVRTLPHASTSDTGTRIVGEKLRVMAIFSGADPSREWEGLRRSLERVADRVEYRAISGEQALRPGRASDVIGMPASGPLLMQEIREFSPNILHFFCHGERAPEQLDMATLTGQPVTLSTSDFKALGNLDSLFFVSLTCCNGARSSASTPSIARQLVSAGVPAACAMREGIYNVDAGVFTGAFYRVLLREVAAAMPRQPEADSGLSTIMLLDALRLTREEMYRGAHRATSGAAMPEPDDSPEWTLPVLFVGSVDDRDLQFTRLVARLQTAIPPSMLKRLDCLRGVRDLLYANGNDEIAEMVEAELAKAEAKLQRRIQAAE